MGLDTMVAFVTGTPFMNGGYDYGYGYGFANNVGHPRLDSVELLVYDGVRTYLGH
jgi:hypothetical protein